MKYTILHPLIKDQYSIVYYKIYLLKYLVSNNKIKKSGPRITKKQSKI